MLPAEIFELTVPQWYALHGGTTANTDLAGVQNPTDELLRADRERRRARQDRIVEALEKGWVR